MGLDHYLIGRFFCAAEYDDKTPDSPKSRQYRAAFDAVQAISPALPTSDPKPYIHIEVEVCRWRKQYAIHDWWIDRVEYQDDRRYVDVEDIVAFHDWLTPLAMSGRADRLAHAVIKRLSGSWSERETVDEWFWMGIEDTMRTITPLVEGFQATEEHKYGVLSGWDFYYDGSW